MLRLPDGTLYSHAGEFDFIDNKVDERTGTVTVRAEFPNPDRLLLPGQFLTVVIEREKAVDRVLIPQAAVLTDQGGAYVLLVNDDDVVEARRIETGQRFGPSLVVEKGLAPGERIVLYGIQKVRPGLTVKPEPATVPSDPMDNATAASVAADQTAAAEQMDDTAGDPAAGADNEGGPEDARPASAEAGAAQFEVEQRDEEGAEAESEASASDLSGGERETEGEAD